MAIAATGVWEVRTTGSDANGGGFDSSVASPGTDFSQQNSAQVAFTDLVIGATTTQVTSVLNPFGSTSPGNFIQITGGSGFTTGIFEILSVSGVTATLDRSAGTAASTGGTGNLGGALATLGKLSGVIVAGNTAWIKATAVYSVSATPFFTANGASGQPIVITGYATTRGDAGQVTVRASTGSIQVFRIGGNLYRIAHLILDANNQTTVISAFITGNNVQFTNCKAMGFTSSGFNLSGNSATLFNCLATGGASSATAAFLYSGSNVTYVGCRATANACPGWGDTVTGATHLYCISDNNTGASSDGFQFSGGNIANYVNCVSFGNGRDGLRLTASTSADALTLLNFITVSNTGFGINSATTTYSAYGGSFGFTAFFSNTGGARNGLPVQPGDVTLTGNPFNGSGSNDFSLNSIAGAGAACRAAGFPGVLQSGGTGFQDIGALQHQDSGSSTPTAVINQIINQYLGSS